MKVNILGSIYHLKFFKEYPLDDDGNEVCGTCDEVNKKLEVSLQEDWKHSLLHEFIEAVRFEGGLDQVISQKTWEIACQQIPKVLLENFHIRLKKK